MIRHLFTGLISIICMFLLSVSVADASTTVHVPADQSTIQAGINAASIGDTLLVAPGTYYENINFKGKAITVTSSNGPSVTVIDGSGVSSVVTFSSNETSNSVLSGFTLQNGNAYGTPNQEGGGIAIETASPTIKNNIVQNNLGVYAGGGIAVNSGSPLIQSNVIRNNSQNPNFDSGVGGGGISVRGAGSARIMGNRIQNNSWNNAGTGFGGGISLFDSGSTLIENNTIQGNFAGAQGAAICMEGNVSGTAIIQNLIFSNGSNADAGIYWFSSPAAIANNTIVDGHLGGTDTVLGLEFSTSLVVANNVIVAFNSAKYAFACGFSDIQNFAGFYNNDIFNIKGTPYVGCTDQTGERGNVSVNPEFVSNGNFRLKGGSPVIDAGNDSAPKLPLKDFAGNPRIINGNGGATAIVDMGTYEFVPVVLAPKSLSFGLEAIGSSTSKTVRLTNAQDKILSISAFSVPKGYSVSGCGGSVAAFTSCNLTVTFRPSTSGSFNGTLTVTDDAGNSPQTVGLFGRAQ